MDLLEGLDEDDVRRFLSGARRRRFARQEVLFHQGDPADSLHLIQSGRVAVRVAGALGETATLDVLGPREVVGELALLESGSSRSATASALEATETIAVSATHFAQLRATHPSVDGVLLALIARRHRATIARLVEALYVAADTRVLRRLVDLAHEYRDGGAGTVIPLSQDDLAGLAGTTRETVNRVLRREVDRGTLTLARRRIAILDLAAIAQRAR